MKYLLVMVMLSLFHDATPTYSSRDREADVAGTGWEASKFGELDTSSEIYCEVSGLRLLEELRYQGLDVRDGLLWVPTETLLQQSPPFNATKTASLSIY